MESWTVRTDCGPSFYVSVPGKMPHANIFGRCEQPKSDVKRFAQIIAAAPDLLNIAHRIQEESAKILAGLPTNHEAASFIRSLRDASANITQEINQ